MWVSSFKCENPPLRDTNVNGEKLAPICQRDDDSRPTEPPTTTEEPTTTGEPITTEEPTTTEEPITTEAATTTEVPTTTAAAEEQTTT